MKKLAFAAAGLFFLFVPSASQAQIKVGVLVSMTGPAASLGIAEKNAVALMDKEINGKSIEYVMLDDASDTTTARRVIEKLASEDKVDLILGGTTTPASLAVVEVVGKSKVPFISMSAGRQIVAPMDDNRHWVFKAVYNDTIIASATAKHMAANGIKTVAVIGFNDAYGESWTGEFMKAAQAAGLTIVADEKYSRTDTSVTAQALKILAAKSDAVLVAAVGTPGTLPQTTLVERGYKGKIYQTMGAVGADFLRVGGAKVEGTIVAVPPMVVAEALPDLNPVRGIGIDFKTKYEKMYGPGSVSAFAGYSWDSFMLGKAALAAALQKAAPGTQEFRDSVRAALETNKAVPTTAGVVDMTPTDHCAFSPDAPVMAEIKDGKLALVK